MFSKWSYGPLQTRWLLTQKCLEHSLNVEYYLSQTHVFWVSVLRSTPHIPFKYRCSDYRSGGIRHVYLTNKQEHHISPSSITLPLRILPIRFHSRGSRIHFKHKTHLQENDVHNCTKSNTSCCSQIHQLRMSFPQHPIPWHTSTWGMQDRCNAFSCFFGYFNFLNQTPVFDWNVVRRKSENTHQRNIHLTSVDHVFTSMVNTAIGRTYAFN